MYQKHIIQKINQTINVYKNVWNVCIVFVDTFYNLKKNHNTDYHSSFFSICVMQTFNFNGSKFLFVKECIDLMLF